MNLFEIAVAFALGFSVTGLCCAAVVRQIRKGYEERICELRSGAIDLKVKVAELSKYQDQQWRWKGQDITSIGGVVWKDTQYVILEPTGKGFTPMFVRRDSPDLESVG